MPEAETTPLPTKARVRVTSRLTGVPEGTAGTVRGTVGLTFPRHRVAFDNGSFVTSVDRRRLVREQDWDEFVSAREEESAAAETADPVEDTGSAPPSTGKEAEGGAPADDRLAALLARSKAAREKAGG